MSPVFNPTGPVGPPGMNNRGPWTATPSPSYSLRDGVRRVNTVTPTAGGYFMCLANGITSDPLTDSTNWVLIAADGAQGSGLIQSDYDAVMPWTIHLAPALSAADIAQKVGTWGFVLETGDILNGALFNSSTAQNDAVGWDLPIAKGTWNVTLWFVKASVCGIATVQIDGSSVGTIDTWAASTTANSNGTITGFTVGSNGKHRLSIVMATKNASATAFELILLGIQLRRTA